MSWSWYIYSTRTAAEVVEVDRELELALAAYEEDHDVDDAYAEAGAGGMPPPTPDELVAYRARFGETLAPDVLARLAQCRATFSFDYVRDEPASSPLQVSILRFCLDRLGPCLMDWGDLSVELGETALGKLARLRSRGRLGEAPPPAKPRKPVKRRAAKPGETRALRILALYEASQDDPDVALDLRGVLAKLSRPALAYVTLLVEHGALTDAVARQRLELDEPAFAAAVAEVERALLGGGS